MSLSQSQKPSLVGRITGGLGRAGNAVLDHPWQGLVVLALLVPVFLYFSAQSSPHHVEAVFTEALDLAKSQPVQLAGVNVGKVDSVDLQGNEAVVKLGINQNWPLRQGTTAIIRYGSTLGQGTRYIQLIPGPNSARPLKEGAVIPQQATTTPVELYQLFDMLNHQTRQNIQGLTAGVSAATMGQSPQIGQGIQGTGQALNSASGLLGDLNQDEPALSALVTQASGATRTLAAREPTIEDLLQVASTTFTEFGTRTAAVQGALDQLTPALVEARTTLNRADTSLDILDGLLTDLRPGLSALQTFIPAARPAVAGLRVLAPIGAGTLQTLTDTAPAVTSFLVRAQPFSGQVRQVLAGLAPQLACVRPYAPEIASFLSQWGSWAQDYDNTSHYARIKVNQGATSDDSYPPTKTSSFIASTGGTIKYADPRPPGLNAGQPWFLPQCGAGPNSINPADDPESSP